MTTSDLESQLWEAANILRGPVDAADFKTYIFPLLFFKRISDVYDGEHEAALEDVNSMTGMSNGRLNVGARISATQPGPCQ
jgi:type I restriction-modification system DNA methylase subunit